MIFESMPPTRLFFHCAIPSMISMAVTSLYTIADGIFVGRFLGHEALAAVNLVMPLVLISFALSDMVAVGSSVQISMLLGQKRQQDACLTFSSSLKLLTLFSCIIGLSGFFLAEPALLMMGADASVAQLATEYLRVYAVFAPLIVVFFAMDNFLRICAKQRYSMLLNVVTALLNIVLDYVFLVVLGYGIWSAALASCLSLTLGTVLALIPFFGRRLPLFFVKGWIAPKQFGRLLANGSSELFTNAASSLLLLILNTVLLRLNGSVAVAAMSVVMYVDSIVGSILFGLANSMQPPISYCHGQGLMPRVWALEKRVLLLAAGISCTTLILMRFAGAALIPMFIQASDTELLAMSLRAMRLFAWSYLVSWVDACLGSYLTALDRPIRSLAVTLCGTLVFPILALTLLTPTLGLDGVWLMPLVAGCASTAVAVSAVLSLRGSSATPGK